MRIDYLTDEERQECSEAAVKAIQLKEGKKPNIEEFRKDHIGKYPAWMVGVVVVILFLFLFFALVPSSIRIYNAASLTFEDGVQNCGRLGNCGPYVGTATILLSEIGAVLFLLASAIVGEGEGFKFKGIKLPAFGQSMLVFASICSIAFAYGGNYFIGIYLADEIYSFTWLETLIPPTLTLISAWVLKKIALYYIINRHAITSAYQEAVKNWEEKVNSIDETNPKYISEYARKIWDKILSKNSTGRKRYSATNRERYDYLKSLPKEEKQKIVAKVIRGDEWISNIESFLQ